MPFNIIFNGPGSWVLMQDGVRVPTANSSIEYLKTMCHVMTDWPHNSPDLNPFENLWSWYNNLIEEKQDQQKN